jgi:23S rRNA (uracil1939-C5)-methyltransferase
MHTINLKIEKPAYGGYGLGFHDGKACFVQYAIPGDEAIVEIYQEKKDYCFGRIVELSKKTESRIEPECSNFGICGGCDYLNVDYNTELRLKKEILIETLKRTGHFNKNDENELPEISVISADRFHYRSHASVKSSISAIGFYEKDSYRIAAFPESGCMLLADELLQKLSELPKINGEIKIAFSSESGFLSSLKKNSSIMEHEHGIIYERDILLFFQTNKFLRSKMLETVALYAELDRSKSFVDIGCGVGFFTLYLANSAKKAFGIDINKDSIKWAKRNAKLNGIGNAFFRALPASEIRSLNERFEAAIADPPRAGLPVKARQALLATAPERIVYVSCNPSTFARDARDLVNSGRKLQKLTMIDMFPGTQHIEVIGLFVKTD